MKRYRTSVKQFIKYYKGDTSESIEQIFLRKSIAKPLVSIKRPGVGAGFQIAVAPSPAPEF